MWLLWITQSEHHVELPNDEARWWQDIFNIAWNTRVSACFTRIQIAVQLREHVQIPTCPVRLLAAIRANSLTLRQSARWQQLAQSSWRNQSWVLRISTATGCAENHYIGKMTSQHYIVCDDDTWLSNYYHTIYMWLVHLCKDTWWRIWLYLCYIRMFHVKHR